jgi:thiamine pyrophosphate-dependent acetolactate synthase large subunit-like protein
LSNFNKKEIMDVNALKIRLQELIDETTDVRILEKIYQQLSSEQKDDWWETLSESQKNRLNESEQQYKRGEVVSNEAVLKKIQQWLQN